MILKQIHEAGYLLLLLFFVFLLFLAALFRVVMTQKGTVCCLKEKGKRLGKLENGRSSGWLVIYGGISLRDCYENPCRSGNS